MSFFARVDRIFHGAFIQQLPHNIVFLVHADNQRYGSQH